MDIVEKLRLVDGEFWWKPLGHGLDTDDLCREAANEIERLREERHALREVLQFYASFATNTSPYKDMVDYLVDNGKLAALALNGD